MSTSPVSGAAVSLLRGAAIGAAEVVPGVSGGTIALIVGIYRQLISAGATLVHAVRQLLGLAGSPPSVRAAIREARQAPWAMLIPLLIGMGIALIIGARVIEPLLENYPVQMNAVFFGLVAAGVLVPIHMVTQAGGWNISALVLVVIGAVAAFVLTGIPPAEVADPSLIVVFFAAMIAVCALALPGVSGSFLLLTLGLYAPTIAAVNDRNLGYLSVFATGAIIGLGVFVSVLRWLLDHHARITLAILTGLMLGSLRALWPWQDEDRGLLAPTTDVGISIVLAAISAAIVLALIAVERRNHADV